VVARASSGEATPAQSVSKELPFDTLGGGMAASVMSRRRVLQLFGGAFLGAMLSPLAGTNAAVAKNNLQNALTVLGLFKDAYDVAKDLGVVDAFRNYLGLPDPEKKKVGYYMHFPSYVGAFEIRIAPEEPSDDGSKSSDSPPEITITMLKDPASAEPKQTAQQGAQPLARPTDTEQNAYKTLALLAPTQRLNDTWVTARQKLQQLYPNLWGHDWSMLQAFYYTQNHMLSIPYKEGWRNENYVLPKENYLQYFTDYGIFTQAIYQMVNRPIQPTLNQVGMRQKAEEFYNKLNKLWLLDRMSPREAYTMAWALYLGQRPS